MPSTQGVHLVGSIPLADTETVFRTCVHSLPLRLKRLPDGETGERINFTNHQGSVFAAMPQVSRNWALNSYDAELADSSLTPEELDGHAKALEASNLQTGYDTAAMESYAVFKRLRGEGVIPNGVKFQVSLPTAANVVAPFIRPALQSRVFPIYEASLFRAMKKLQDAIPHEDLAIQIDLAVDTGFWEGVFLPPWFDNVKDFVLDYIIRMIGQVHEDVELGLHNCYGDLGHKHFFEPKSLSAITERTLALLERTPHRIDFVHAPVPTSAMSFLPEYYAPLGDLYPKLKEHGAELYLGVVHSDDLEGTKERIAEAKKHASEFGVATECGWGRTPLEDIPGIIKIAKEVSQPVL